MRRRVFLAGAGVGIFGLMRVPNPRLDGYERMVGYRDGGYGTTEGYGMEGYGE